MSLDNGFGSLSNTQDLFWCTSQEHRVRGAHREQLVNLVGCYPNRHRLAFDSATSCASGVCKWILGFHQQ